MCEIGFVYRWYDSYTSKYYVGIHRGVPTDNYKGSGVYFSRAYKKRPEFFSREILYFGHNILELEEFILESVDAENNNEYYNLTNKNAGVTKHTSETKKKISESKTGNTFFTKEHRIKLSAKKQGKLHPQYGKKGHFKKGGHSEEFKVYMSDISTKYNVYCELNGKTYKNCKFAAYDLRCSSSHICGILNGRKNNKYKISKVNIE